MWICISLSQLFVFIWVFCFSLGMYFSLKHQQVGRGMLSCIINAMLLEMKAFVLGELHNQPALNVNSCWSHRWSFLSSDIVMKIYYFISSKHLKVSCIFRTAKADHKCSLFAGCTPPLTRLFSTDAFLWRGKCGRLVHLLSWIFWRAFVSLSHLNNTVVN